ncbi:MAG: hypothetical protein JSV04_07140 [Candidatus Heimdallarchaeota archaeon]|nr:MAG: hypothetical protein JSV04_07140 [Candidatus Heimdallarchaeota archaeon]
MENDQISDIIAQEVNRALKARHNQGSSFRVLGILTHLGNGIDQLFEALLGLSGEGIPVLIWTLKEIDNLIQIRARSASIPKMQVVVDEKTNFGLPEFEGLDYIIFGAFGFEIADKIIQLQDDDPIVNILTQGLLVKVPVYIMMPFPLANLAFEYEPSSRMNQELRKRLSLLTELGFGLMDERDLKDQYLKQKPYPPDLITESYVENLRGKVRELRLPHSTIITPLAQEKARDLEIRIIRI